MPQKPHLPPILKRAASELLSKSSTERYPDVKPKLADNYRGEPVLNCTLCVGCGTCSRVCPAKAIEMVEVDGRKYPQVELSKCVFCFQCAESCPKKAITNSTVYELATTDKADLTLKPKVNGHL